MGSAGRGKRFLFACLNFDSDYLEHASATELISAGSLWHTSTPAATCTNFQDKNISKVIKKVPVWQSTAVCRELGNSEQASGTLGTA